MGTGNGIANIKSILKAGGNIAAIQPGKSWKTKGDYPTRAELATITNMQIPSSLKLFAAPGGTDGASTNLNYPDEYDGVVFDVENGSSPPFNTGAGVQKLMKQQKAKGKIVIYCPAGLPWNPSKSKFNAFQDEKYWNNDSVDAVAPMLYWSNTSYTGDGQLGGDECQSKRCALYAVQQAVKQIAPKKPLILTYESFSVTKNAPSIISDIVKSAKGSRNIIGMMGWLSNNAQSIDDDANNITAAQTAMNTIFKRTQSTGV